MFDSFQSERLGTNINLILHRALIMSLITYACPILEFATVTYLLKFQRLQNNFLRTLGKFPKFTPTRELHVVFKISYVYDFITNVCGQQAEVIQNHENANVCNIRHGRTMQTMYKRLKLGGGQAYDRSSD
jgi:hypothetical protein